MWQEWGVMAMDIWELGFGIRYSSRNTSRLCFVRNKSGLCHLSIFLAFLSSRSLVR